jgi:polysaccharide export outer membrane protein
MTVRGSQVTSRAPKLQLLVFGSLTASFALALGCAKNPPKPAGPQAGEIEATDAQAQQADEVESPSETESEESGAGELEEGRTRRQVGPRLSTYYLSADDEIRISVYGYGELDRTLRIPPDGHIYYPALGEIDVDGMSIPEFRILVTDSLKTAEEQRIAAGDQIRVSVYRQELDATTIVPSSGRVTLPLTGEVELVGLTVEEANQAIALKLARYVVNPSVSTTILKSALPGRITNPHVSVEVLRFGGHKILVLGEVRQPGVYLDEGGSRLLEIVALAGGPTVHSKLGQVALIRPATETSAPRSMLVNLESAIETGGLSDNPPIQRGDVIYVPRSTIANVAQFFEYVYTIARPFVTIETGIWLGQNIDAGPRLRTPRRFPVGGRTAHLFPFVRVWRKKRVRDAK